MKEMAVSRENGEQTEEAEAAARSSGFLHVLRVGMHFWLTGLCGRAPVMRLPSGPKTVNAR